MKKNSTVWILVLYLLGLFMGALDTGIVTPARSVIQTQLGVNESVGIWMITIFTLAYAASIPITGKLADRYGRKVMYMVSILLFGLGSLICAVSANFDSFGLLLAGRVIQAFGGGGIMPIVTAEIGTSFPPEKRGMALGMVGGVYGIANILGSSAGSGILSIAGNEGWHWLFLINVPISIFILVFGFFFLENHREAEVKPMDFTGTVVLTTMILSLMYGLTNIEFFDFFNSLQSVTVYPYLIAFVALLPLFVFIEKRAKDPIINLGYFTDKNMLITYITGILVGIAMMGMIFVPQFAENALKIKTGAGGYFVTILGVFAGVGAPLSGKFVDKYGAKAVLMGGFLFNLAGGLFLAFVATQYMNIWTVLVALFFMGLGMGFTMGTPLNYMVLSSVDKANSNSALATLSLIRSIGTVIAPTIMVGFLAAAGTQLQDDLMKALPEPPTQLVLKQADELKPLLEQIKQDEELMKRISDPSMLDLDAKLNQSANTDMTSSEEGLPADLVEDLKKADVTSITDTLVKLSDRMFSTNVTPELIAEIQDGISKGVDGLTVGIDEMSKAKLTLEQQRADLIGQKTDLIEKRNGVISAQKGINEAISGAKQGVLGMSKALEGVKMSPAPAAKAQADALAKQISQTNAQIATLEGKLKGLKEAEAGMAEAISGMEDGIAGMTEGIKGIEDREVLLSKTVAKMAELRDAIPGAFEDSKETYLKDLSAMQPEIQSIFQSGLNKGFKQMYLLVAALSALGILVLSFYKTPKTNAKVVLDTEQSEA